jgi:D-proline reductase (dithiol) PrdB
VCHQTVGLIARRAEAAGIPTLSLSSARDITAAVHPPRAAFVDWPLGHTSGRPGEAGLNRTLLHAALGAFETITEPGTIVDLPFPWADDDDWKDRVMRPRPAQPGSAAATAASDDRVERHATPQFQCDDDAAAAAARHAGADCAVCAGIDY